MLPYNSHFSKELNCVITIHVMLIAIDNTPDSHLKYSSSARSSRNQYLCSCVSSIHVRFPGLVLVASFLRICLLHADLISFSNELLQVITMGFRLCKHLGHSRWIYLLLKVTWISPSTSVPISRISVPAGRRFLLSGSFPKFYIPFKVIASLSRTFFACSLAFCLSADRLLTCTLFTTYSCAVYLRQRKDHIPSLKKKLLLKTP